MQAGIELGFPFFQLPCVALWPPYLSGHDDPLPLQGCDWPIPPFLCFLVPFGQPTGLPSDHVLGPTCLLDTGWPLLL